MGRERRESVYCEISLSPMIFCVCEVRYLDVRKHREVLVTRNCMPAHVVCERNLLGFRIMCEPNLLGLRTLLAQIQFSVFNL